MPAVQLRALSGVYRRTRDHEGGEGLQRLHDPKRSAAIRDFVRFGHPYSSLPNAARNEASAAMRKPGWLPTAIVVNILTANDERRGRKVADSDLVSIRDDGGNRAELTLPYFDRLEQWMPSDLTRQVQALDGCVQPAIDVTVVRIRATHDHGSAIQAGTLGRAAKNRAVSL